jgi:hypothetical protein
MSNFLQSLGVLPLIDSAVKQGRGVVGAVEGQKYDVYRQSAKTAASGIISPASQIASGFPSLFKKMTDKADLEIESIVKALYFTAMADTRMFLPGDVFVQQATTYLPDRGVFTMVANRPMPHHPVFVSTPIFATITRPESNPEHIDSGRVPQSVPVKAYEWPLTVSGMDYAFLQTGTPATVPIGMIMARLRDMPRSDSSDGALYDDTRRQTWDVFVPLLSGQPLINRDIITGSSGDRYEITGVQASTASAFGQWVSTSRIRS